MGLDKDNLQKILESAMHLVDDKALDQLGLKADDRQLLNGLLGKLKNKESLSMNQKMSAMELLDRLGPKSKGALEKNPALQDLVKKVMEQAKGTSMEKQLQEYINRLMR